VATESGRSPLDDERAAESATAGDEDGTRDASEVPGGVNGTSVAGDDSGTEDSSGAEGAPSTVDDSAEEADTGDLDPRDDAETGEAAGDAAADVDKAAAHDDGTDDAGHVADVSRETSATTDSAAHDGGTDDDNAGDDDADEARRVGDVSRETSAVAGTDDADGPADATDADADADEVPAEEASDATPDDVGDTTQPMDAVDTAPKDTASEDTAPTATKRSPRPASADAPTAPTPRPAAARSTPPAELHSGHKLAQRYRLEECLTRRDGLSSWRAVDEKLRRAVGIHVLPAGHAQARPVLAAARSAALLGDPRFVQVLDAVEADELVYVIHEWLPDATDLTAILAEGPLDPHEAYQLVSQLSQAMAAAHREGLAHLRLGPDCVLRTDSGQYRVRGLAVSAALYGVRSERPQQADTEAVGALLYAALTQRWPYPEDAHGLTGLPKDLGLVPPDQVRAGVHRGLAEVAMRALANDGATASRELAPCTTPEELARAVAALPRIRPPEPTLPPYQRTTFQQGGYRQPPARPAATPPTPVVPIVPPPALPGRTGKALKWAVSALLIAALGLGSWQLADTLMDRGDGSHQGSSGTVKHHTTSDGSDRTKPQPLTVHAAAEYAPDGSFQHPDAVKDTYDHDSGTYWRTHSFNDGPVLAPYKKGVGIIYDLGSTRKLSSASIQFLYGGDHTTVELYAASSLSPSASLTGMKHLGTTTTSASKAAVSLKTPVAARYVLVWLTAMPYSEADSYNRAGYKQAITDVTFEGR
jgi:hypothetical protein